MTLHDQKSALVIGSSGGIGRSITAQLGQTGYKVIPVSRSSDHFDLSNETSIAELSSRLSGHTFDLIIVATGILQIGNDSPEKSYDALTAESMAEAFATNAIGPTLIFKYFQKLLVKDRRSVFAALSARVGSIGDNRLGGWMSYRASKAALNQLIRCAAIEEKRRNKEAIIVALHPGTIETNLTRRYAKGRFTASPEEAAKKMLSALNALTPAETGSFIDYDGDKVPW